MAIPQPSQSVDPTTGLAESFSGLIQQSGEGSDGELKPALPVRPNYKFFLHHWASEWSVVDIDVEVEVDGKMKKKKESFWVPTLAKHVVHPGVNMNRTLKTGETPRGAYDGQILLNIRQGSTYLDLADFRTRLPDGRLYRSQAPARHPQTGAEGIYFLETLMKPRDKVDNKRLKFDIDRPAYNRWRLDLVRLGVVRPPAPAVLRAKVQHLKGEIGRCEAMVKLDAETRRRRVKEVTAEWKRWDTATIPKLDPVFLAYRQEAAA